MPQGLQTFDAAGNVVLDTSKLVMKRFASLPITVTGTALNTVGVSVPPTQSILAVAITPLSVGAVAERIETEVGSGQFTWRARQNDGLNYRLDVMIV